MPAKWSNIVVAVGDPYRKTQRAVGKAAQIATRSGAHLELVHVFAPPPRVFARGANHRRKSVLPGLSRDDRHASLERLAAPLRRRGLGVRVTMLWDTPPHEALVRHVRRRRTDLLVVESNRHSRLSRWLLTNTDWELVRSCPCPLWFVKSAGLPPAPRILAAIDPMHANARPAGLDSRILAAALDVQRHVRGSVSVCHVAARGFTYEMGGIFGEPVPVALPPQVQRRMDEKAAKAANALAARYRISPKARVLEKGEPTQGLPAVVRRLSTNLLVMGAVSRSPLRQRLIGSTAEHVIDDVDCDVLVVKPAGFRSRVPHTIRREQISLA